MCLEGGFGPRGIPFAFPAQALPFAHANLISFFPTIYCLFIAFADRCLTEIFKLDCRYTDMEAEDYSFYQGLEFLLTHDVKDLGYDLSFSTEVRQSFTRLNVYIIDGGFDSVAIVNVLSSLRSRD